MADLEFLGQVISEVSHGVHDLVTDPNMEPVTVLLRSGGSELVGNTTLELWNDYKRMVGEENLRLHLVC